MAAACATLVAAAAMGVAQAHHSYVMFDRSKVVAADAVVRIWQFTSPHATLWVYINDEAGKPKLWAIEAPGPTQLLNHGWGVNTVSPGDKVHITLNPLRSGEHGGSLLSVRLADGRQMVTAGPPRPPSSKP